MTSDDITCKYCGTNSVKFGMYKGEQLYWCKACKRKFRANNNLFHMAVPSNYVSSAIDMYYRGMSINDICEHMEQEHKYKPSKNLIYYWVNKYTNLAIKHFKDFHPEVGDIWVADETMLDVDGGHKIWFYDIIDTKTRFLLASRVAISRTTGDAELLMREASKVAGKKPKEVVTDQQNSYLDGIGEAFGAKTEHVIGHPFKTKDTGESTSGIERFHGTLKDRTKIFKSFRDVETLIEFTDGWLVYYNYFKPHSSLDGKTPAEFAKVKYDVKNWADLTKLTKDKEIPIPVLPKLKYDMTKAYKRHRVHRATKNNDNTIRGLK